MHAYTQREQRRKGTNGSCQGGHIFRVLCNVLLTQHRVDEFLMQGKSQAGRGEKMNKVKCLICAVAQRRDRSESSL